VKDRPLPPGPPIDDNGPPRDEGDIDRDLLMAIAWLAAIVIIVLLVLYLWMQPKDAADKDVTELVREELDKDVQEEDGTGENGTEEDPLPTTDED
jgi:hypothetical protein